jgi:RNA polymerase sigma factor (sigma-70 family)
MTWVDAVERYSRLVLSIPRRHGLSDQDAQDVLQSTWVTAFEKRATPPPEDEFVGWIVSIAFWTTRGFLRDARRRPALLPDVGQIEPADAIELVELVETAEREQAVREALADLSERDRRLLTELFLAPVPASYAEVASMLGIAGGSVGALRGRALGRLRRALEKRGVIS